MGALAAVIITLKVRIRSDEGRSVKWKYKCEYIKNSNYLIKVTK